jgi:hypothetical protein
VVFVREVLRNALVIIFGLLGIAAPFLSVFVATFLGKTNVSMFNSTMIMLLSILIIVYQLITSFNNFFNGHKRIFLLGILLLFIDLVSFLFNLTIFIAL